MDCFKNQGFENKGFKTGRFEDEEFKDCGFWMGGFEAEIFLLVAAKGGDGVRDFVFKDLDENFVDANDFCSASI